SAVLPQMVSLPVDTFSCCLNAICLYYMLYKRRIVQLRSFATNAPVYVLVAICSTLVLVNWYGPALRFYDHLLPDYRRYRTIVFAVAFSAFTMLLCSLLRSLMGNLLLKSS